MVDIELWTKLEWIRDEANRQNNPVSFEVGNKFLLVFPKPIKVGQTNVLICIYKLSNFEEEPLTTITPTTVNELKGIMIRNGLLEEFYQNLEKLTLLLS